jgi:hypothetical protein
MTIDESERRLAEALRAQARGGGRPPAPTSGSSAPPADVSVRTLLLLWLLGGAVLGSALALVSLLLPGVLPAFG